MINIPDPLDEPATPETLRHQAINGVLDTPTFRRALMIIGYTPSSREWMALFNIGLLILGTGLLVSGIIFFFAFNWQGMHRFLKLGLLQGSVIVTLGLALWVGLDRLVGKVALTAASLLIGATLAVYGQVYQTGADSYQLFLTWAILITPWVLISRWWPLWGIWILLLNIALALYVDTVSLDPELIFAAFFGLNAIFFGLAEWAQRRAVAWINTHWIPRILAIPMLGALVSASITFIVDPKDRTLALAILVLLFIVISITMLYWYSERFFDAFLLMIVAFAVCICIDTWLFHIFDFDDAGLLIMGMLIIMQTAAIVTWIRQRSDAWRMRHHDS